PSRVNPPWSQGPSKYTPYYICEASEARATHGERLHSLSAGAAAALEVLDHRNDRDFPSTRRDRIARLHGGGSGSQVWDALGYIHVAGLSGTSRGQSLAYTFNGIMNNRRTAFEKLAKIMRGGEP
ncbi:uncharacterized protein N7525_004292, partial [Penicillium rubens]|uniref:uncharacterized protein n=1 Tax=Penicillium rubens TaxID=1108849 RepID=UPI002A5A84D5